MRTAEQGFTGSLVLPEHHERPDKILAVNRLLTSDWEQAREQKDTLRQNMLELGGYSSMEEAMTDIGQRTAIVFIAGGVATRWDKSFDTPEAQTVLEDPQYEARRGKARGLAQVPNRLPQNVIGGDTIPVLAYSLWTSMNIPGAKRYLIHSEDTDIQELIEMRHTAEELGLAIQLKSQRKRNNNPKPSGHADALVQNIDILNDVDFILPQFVSDATSPATITDSLLTLAVLNTCGMDVRAVVPTVKMAQPKYSVFIDQNGLVRKMGHAKLLGEESLSGTDSELFIAGSQVGIYPFDATQLQKELKATHERYNQEGSYLFLPGHEAAGVNEYAIDDAVISFAVLGRVRQLAVANEIEILHSAKTVPELPQFIKMIEMVLWENGIEPRR
jgi:hypothetical protein